MNKLLSYPDTKKGNTIVFKCNSDDFQKEHIRKISAYLKKKGYKYKYYRQYSDTKLMSWGCYTIEQPGRHIDFELNNKLAYDIVRAALFEGEPQEMKSIFE